MSHNKELWCCLPSKLELFLLVFPMKVSWRIWCCVILYYEDYSREVESLTKHSMEYSKCLILVFNSVPWNSHYYKPKSWTEVTTDLDTCVCPIAVPVRTCRGKKRRLRRRKLILLFRNCIIIIMKMLVFLSVTPPLFVQTEIIQLFDVLMTLFTFMIAQRWTCFSGTLLMSPLVLPTGHLSSEIYPLLHDEF